MDIISRDVFTKLFPELDRLGVDWWIEFPEITHKSDCRLIDGYNMRDVFTKRFLELDSPGCWFMAIISTDVYTGGWLSELGGLVVA